MFRLVLATIALGYFVAAWDTYTDGHTIVSIATLFGTIVFTGGALWDTKLGLYVRNKLRNKK